MYNKLSLFPFYCCLVFRKTVAVDAVVVEVATQQGTVCVTLVGEE